MRTRVSRGPRGRSTGIRSISGGETERPETRMVRGDSPEVGVDVGGLWEVLWTEREGAWTSRRGREVRPETRSQSTVEHSIIVHVKTRDKENMVNQKEESWVVVDFIKRHGEWVVGGVCGYVFMSFCVRGTPVPETKQRVNTTQES